MDEGLKRLLEKADALTSREAALRNFHRKYAHLMNDELLAAFQEELKFEHDAYMLIMKDARKHIERGGED